MTPYADTRQTEIGRSRATGLAQAIVVRRRNGFTMIEILVVVGIIALLAALSLMAFRGFVGNARVKATQVTVKKIDEIMHKRMQAFNRWIESQAVEAPGRPDYVHDTDYAYLSATPGDEDFRDQALVLARKNRFREFFPQQFSDVPAGGSFPPAGFTTANQNAECLYYIIMNAQTFGGEAVDDGAFIDAEYADADGDGLMEFVDNWNNPIRYYRWPTRLIRPGGGSVDLHQGAQLLMGDIPPGSAQTEDPDDPLGLFSGVTTLPNTQVFEEQFHTPDTYHVPLIVSAGQDGSGPAGGGLGLNEPAPADTTNFGQLAQPITGQTNALTDNISNLNTRVGGR
ncbi:MAG: type II secretion system protein [Planctomycetaceae bacterium]